MLQCRVVVETAAVVLLVLCGTDEDMSVPLIREIAHIGNGEVHAFILATFDKGGETVQVIEILCLKGLVVAACVA